MTNKPTIKDSLLLCASDLQHSAIYDNHSEMQSCLRAVADRITALASVIDGVERAALAAPAQAMPAPGAPTDDNALRCAVGNCMFNGEKAADDLGIRLPQPAARGAAQAAPVGAESWLDLLAEARAALWQPANAALCERLDAFIDAARAAQKGTND